MITIKNLNKQKGRNVMKKNSIISIIIILLVLLTAILFVRGCSQEGSEMKNYNVAGTYTETATYQNGEIKVSGVNIENATFTGNLTVVDSVVDGDIRLTNSAVQGELLIKGGGTVYLDGGTYQNITLEKQGVKIVLLGQATVEPSLPERRLISWLIIKVRLKP